MADKKGKYIDKFLKKADKAIQEGVKKCKSQTNSPQVVQQETSIADELAKIAGLKEQGIISEEEFQTMKQKLLSK